MSRVLAVGNDTTLLHTRSLVLEKTGAFVCCANPGSARAMLQREFFEVVVLCHTISISDKAAIHRQINLFWPLCRTVAVGTSNFSSVSDDESDICIPWQLGPQVLMNAVASLLKQFPLDTSGHESALIALSKAHALRFPFSHRAFLHRM